MRWRRFWNIARVFHRGTELVWGPHEKASTGEKRSGGDARVFAEAFSAPVFFLRNLLVSGLTSPGARPNVAVARLGPSPNSAGSTVPGCWLLCIRGRACRTSGGGIRL